MLLFCSDGSLNIKTRMPFSKARMILPRPMFDPALPMISKVAPCKLFSCAHARNTVIVKNFHGVYFMSLYGTPYTGLDTLKKEIYI